MMLFNTTTLSVRDLQAAVNSITDTEQCYTQHLTTHLLTNFLLFSSGGHMIAQEFISHVSVVLFLYPPPPFFFFQFKQNIFFLLFGFTLDPLKKEAT